MFAQKSSQISSKVKLGLFKRKGNFIQKEIQVHAKGRHTYDRVSDWFDDASVCLDLAIYNQNMQS